MTHLEAGNGQAPLGTRIGFIGLGGMGAPIAGHLCKAGHTMRVFDINPDACQQAMSDGAVVTASPSEAAEQCELLFVMVFNGEQANQVLFGENGAASNLMPGSTVVLSCTVSPAEAQAIASRLQAVGVHVLDAPVSGGVLGAQSGTLTVMVSGSDEALAAAQPALAAFSGQVFRVGPNAGDASTMKAVNQLLVISHMALSAEALAMGARAGLDPQLIYEVICQSAGKSHVFERRVPAMIAGDTTPRSRIDISMKDLSIAVDMARGLNSPVPVGAAALQVFAMAAAGGLARHSDTAILNVYEAFGAFKVAAREPSQNQHHK